MRWARAKKIIPLLAVFWLLFAAGSIFYLAQDCSRVDSMAEIRNKYFNIEPEPCLASVDYILSVGYLIAAILVGLNLLTYVREEVLERGMTHVKGKYLGKEKLFGIEDLKNPFLFLIKLALIVFVVGVLLLVSFLFFFPIAYFTHFDSRYEILLSVGRWSDEYSGGYLRMRYLIVVVSVLAFCSGILEWVKEKFSSSNSKDQKLTTKT